MTLQLDVRGRRVLLRGCNARTAALAANLLEQGAQVGVDAGRLTTAMTDLLNRGLISQAEGANPGEFDLIIGVDTRAVLPPRGRSNGGGRVTLVGGGPGAPGLLTTDGWAALQTADVVLYDRLAPLATLQDLSAKLVDVGKIPRGRSTAQEAINELLITEARRGNHVVRFKGGDPFVFGRGSEEWQACAESGVPVTVVPGVSSAIAAPGLAGIPVTHRGLTQGFTVISGHVGPDNPASSVDWAALARANTTLVVLMGVATLPTITTTLIGHGLAGDTPAAVVADAGLPSQRVLRAPLERIAEVAADAQVAPPAVTVIGQVAGLELG
jgi:uroporphyrin-III C-methyltransferase